MAIFNSLNGIHADSIQSKKIPLFCISLVIAAYSAVFESPVPQTLAIQMEPQMVP